MLWSHCRDMRVEVFSNKIVYNIPIYSETIFKFFTYDLKKTSSGLRLTLSQVPTQLHSVKSSYDNQLIEKVQLDETDKYLLSHQLVFREMK